MSEILPPNQEGWYGIRSIHSYDTAAPRNYNALVSRWNEQDSPESARRFSFLDNLDVLAREEFALTGVSLVLARSPVTADPLEPLAEIDGTFLLQLKEPTILHLQTPHYTESSHEGVTLLPPYMRADTDTPIQLLDQDDYRVFSVVAQARETILFISQQHHPSWQARDGTGRRLETVLIDEFYQGVLVPPGTELVRMEFRPPILLSWIAQVAFLGIAVWLVGQRYWATRGERGSA